MRVACCQISREHHLQRESYCLWASNLKFIRKGLTAGTWAAAKKKAEQEEQDPVEALKLAKRIYGRQVFLERWPPEFAWSW